jgi:hypothetical protein
VWQGVDWQEITVQLFGYGIGVRLRHSAFRK